MLFFKFLLLYILGIGPLTKVTTLKEIRTLLFIFYVKLYFHLAVDLGPFGKKLWIYALLETN